MTVMVLSCIKRYSYTIDSSISGIYVTVEYDGINYGMSSVDALPKTGTPAIENSPAQFSGLGITGEFTEGSILTADYQITDANGWGGVANVSWYHSDDLDTVVGTGSSYVLSASDVGKQMYFTVSFTDYGGFVESTQYSGTQVVQAITGDSTEDSNGNVYEFFNGHFYEFIDTAMSWDDAVAYADSLSFNGMQGHLVTITSPEENDFVYDLGRLHSPDDFIWLGASDTSVESEWVWRTGPEEDFHFWTGYTNNGNGPGSGDGTTVNEGYANWSPDHLND